MGVGRNPLIYNTQSPRIRSSQSSWGDNKQKITIHGQGNDEKNGILKTKEYFLKQPLIGF